jgi:hypothetical protein
LAVGEAAGGVAGIELRRQGLRVVGLDQLDAEDFPGGTDTPVPAPTLGVEPIVDPVAEVGRATDDGINGVDLDDPGEVVDRRGVLDGQERLDRMLEALGIAVVRCMKMRLKTGPTICACAV